MRLVAERQASFPELEVASLTDIFAVIINTAHIRKSHNRKKAIIKKGPRI